MSYLSFKAVEHYGDFTESTILRESLTQYFNWGFLSIGAFQNIQINSSGAGGRNDCLLYPVKSNLNYYSNGQVWQSNRQNWVWESGMSYGIQPIEISGIYVGNTFQPTSGVGPYSFNIDYPNGRIIFNTAISDTSVVKCAYSAKRVRFTSVDDESFKKIQQFSLLNQDSNFPIGSGMNVELSNLRVQTPLVAIEPVPRKDFPYGIQLGGGTYMFQDVLFHIYSDTSTERDKIFDIITKQFNTTIVLTDINKLADNNIYPLNIKGNIVNQSTRNYTNLVGEGSQYGWRQCTFERMIGQEMSTYNNSFFGAVARMTAKIPMTDV